MNFFSIKKLVVWYNIIWDWGGVLKKSVSKYNNK